MLNETDRNLLRLARAKRYELTEKQRATKKITRAPHTPGPEYVSPSALAQAMQRQQAHGITVLHAVEAQIRGKKQSHGMTGVVAEQWKAWWVRECEKTSVAT